LQILTVLDESVHDLLDDENDAADAEKCEEFVFGVKRAVRKADRIIKDKRGEIVPHTTGKSQVTQSKPTVIQEIKLPTIKLESFAGNIETWSRFWEQFESSVDKNQSASTINKHVFLRGYLEGEPKRLVDGIAVTEERYEQTKKILQAQYDDKSESSKLTWTTRRTCNRPSRTVQRLSTPRTSNVIAESDFLKH
jgi:hypothetical protein